MPKIIGIKCEDIRTNKQKKYITPHSELGMIPAIQDIARWNGSTYEQVKSWLENGKSVYTSFSCFTAELEA